MASTRALASTTFKSLTTRNYRLFFLGQGTSVIGTWTQTIALGWLVLDLSDDSGTALGVAFALQFLPSMLLSAYGGVLVDRFDNRKVLLVTQISMGVVATMLGVVVVAGVVELWMVYVLVFLFGVAQSVDNPARLAIISEIVSEEDLANAVALNSTTFQLARVVGPAIAGVVVLAIGIGPCFFLNAASYLALIAALLMMRTDEMYPRDPVPYNKGQVRAGMRYIWHTPELRLIMALSFVVGLLTVNFPVTLPLLARITFDGDIDTYSLFTIAMGIPALFAGLWVAHRSDATERLVFVVGIVLGSAILVSSVAPSIAVFVAVITVAGAAMIVFTSTLTTMTQLRADPQMRGRVMAVFVLAILGTGPIGGPLVGWIAEVTNPRVAFGIGGLAALLATLVFGGMMLRARKGVDELERERQTDFATALTTTTG